MSYQVSRTSQDLSVVERPAIADDMELMESLITLPAQSGDRREEGSKV